MNGNSEKPLVCIRLGDEMLSDGISALLEESFRTVSDPAFASVVITDGDLRPSLSVSDGRVIIVGEGSGCRMRFSRPVSCAALLRAADMIAGEREHTVRSKDGVWTVNAADKSISGGGHTVRLSETEFRLLSLLMSHKGKAVSREDVAADIFAGTDNKQIYDVYVCHLRKKLRPVLGDGAILSVRGSGYMLRGDVLFPEEINQG